MVSFEKTLRIVKPESVDMAMHVCRRYLHVGCGSIRPGKTAYCRSRTACKHDQPLHSKYALAHDLKQASSKGENCMSSRQGSSSRSVKTVS